MFEHYWNIELKCRKFTRVLTKLVFFHQCPYVATMFYTIYRVSIGKLDTDSWPHLYNFAVPFNGKSVWGWYLLWFIQFNVDFLYVFCMVFTTSYFVCCCYYVGAVCKQFDFVMQSCTEIVEKNGFETSPIKRQQNLRNITYRIREAVEIHVKIFE